MYGRNGGSKVVPRHVVVEDSRIYGNYVVLDEDSPSLFEQLTAGERSIQIREAVYFYRELVYLAVVGIEGDRVVGIVLELEQIV